MSRRYSRGAPATLNVEDQKALVAIGDNDPEIRECLETLLEVKWSSLTFGKKLYAVAQYLESGYLVLSFAAASEGRSKLIEATARKKGEISLADRVELLEIQNEMLREQNERLKAEKAEIRKQAVTAAAATAMAVHSTKGDH